MSSASDVLERIDDIRPWQEELYRDLHGHPELSSHEVQTVAAIARRLEDSATTYSGSAAATWGSRKWQRSDRAHACLHLAAVTQVRMRGRAGRAYYDRKIAEGKTHKEALRCLKRQLAVHLWRTMIRDEHRRQHRDEQKTGLGGHTGAALQSSATGPTPTASSSDKSVPGPATNQPTTTGNPTA